MYLNPMISHPNGTLTHATIIRARQHDSIARSIQVPGLLNAWAIKIKYLIESRLLGFPKLIHPSREGPFRRRPWLHLLPVRRQQGVEVLC